MAVGGRLDLDTEDGDAIESAPKTLGSVCVVRTCGDSDWLAGELGEQEQPTTVPSD